MKKLKPKSPNKTDKKPKEINGKIKEGYPIGSWVFYVDSCYPNELLSYIVK